MSTMKPGLEVKLPEGTKVDATLNVVRKSFNGINTMPEGIPAQSAGELVMAMLLSCFAKAGYIAEGPLQDLIFGFENGPENVPKQVIANGLIQLRQAGYIYYSTPTGVVLTDDDLLRSGKDNIWIRYAQKFLYLLN